MSSKTQQVTKVAIKGIARAVHRVRAFTSKHAHTTRAAIIAVIIRRKVDSVPKVLVQACRAVRHNVAATILATTITTSRVPVSSTVSKAATSPVKAATVSRAATSSVAAMVSSSTAAIVPATTSRMAKAAMVSRVATSPVRAAMASSVKAAISSVAATASSVRVAISSVAAMASSVKVAISSAVVSVSAREAMTPTLNIR